MRHRLMPASPLHRHLLAGVLALGLAGCATAPHPTASSPDLPLTDTAWAQASALTPEGPSPGWQHQVFGNRQPSRYKATHHQGRPALLAEGSGNSLVRYRMRVKGDRLGALRFSWYVPQLHPEFDLQDRDSEDAVARVILTFDGDRKNFTARDRLLSELAHLVTGEPLPHATLMYVWDHEHPVDTILDHPSTRRIKMLVVKSGGRRLGQWVDLQRDVQADYQKAFGEAAPTLIGVGLMTDGNNTGLSPKAWYGPVALGTQR